MYGNGDWDADDHAPERYKAECYVHNSEKKGFYALSWEEIADNAYEDEFLYNLKNAMKNNNVSEIENLIKGKQIQCSEHTNGVGKIKIEDLSLYMDVVMVRDRIWAPESLRHAFFNNLHLGHRGVSVEQYRQLRVFWKVSTV